MVYPHFHILKSQKNVILGYLQIFEPAHQGVQSNTESIPPGSPFLAEMLFLPCPLPKKKQLHQKYSDDGTLQPQPQQQQQQQQQPQQQPQQQQQQQQQP